MPRVQAAEQKVVVTVLAVVEAAVQAVPAAMQAVQEATPKEAANAVSVQEGLTIERLDHLQIRRCRKE